MVWLMRTAAVCLRSSMSSRLLAFDGSQVLICKLVRCPGRDCPGRGRIVSPERDAMPAAPLSYASD